jgi:hypothetical protein
MIRNLARHRPDFDTASAPVYRSKPCRSAAAMVSLALIGLILAGCAQSTVTDAPETERVSRSTQSLERTSKHPSKYVFKHAFKQAPAPASERSIALPEPELLVHQAAPDCEFKSAVQTDNDLALRIIKLDYEQQCYRQSESILRARMERLQDAVSKAIQSLK